MCGTVTNICRCGLEEHFRSVGEFELSLYRLIQWMIFCPPFEGKLVPIVFLCCFLCSCVSMWKVPKSIEKAGKPQNWSAMGCNWLTPWSAGGSLLVPEPLVAVLSATTRPHLPGRGRMPRRAGSPSALADKGRLGRPPISFAPPLPAPPGRRTRWQIGRHRRRAQSSDLRIGLT
jgi:hypothetical protein